MRWIPILIILFLSVAMTPCAQAHVFLDHSRPKVGGTVDESPTQIKLWFTGELEPASSTAKVEDVDGKQVDKRDVHLDDKDRSLLEVSVPPLSSGKYKVIWQAVSTDGHKTEGHFEFTVR